MNPQRPIAVIVDTQHVHLGQADQRLADTRRVALHRGLSESIGVRNHRFLSPCAASADPQPNTAPRSEPKRH